MNTIDELVPTLRYLSFRQDMLNKTRHRIKLVHDDCQSDAIRTEGKPFTSSVIAEIIGEHLAMIDALAISMTEIIDYLEGMGEGEAK